MAFLSGMEVPRGVLVDFLPIFFCKGRERAGQGKGAANLRAPSRQWTERLAIYKRTHPHLPWNECTSTSKALGDGCMRNR